MGSYFSYMFYQQPDHTMNETDQQREKYDHYEKSLYANVDQSVVEGNAYVSQKQRMQAKLYLEDKPAENLMY